jgi:outer membrane receptor protein involved in Fe transport
MHQHGDTLNRRPIQIGEVTITTAPVRREEPLSAISISPTVIQRTPAINAYDLLRQTAGLEVHDQGQGPGFASNASLRGFSSDHSTDLALWIDGVPINEPVNGHSEGYNDWSLLFPLAAQSIDVFKGPTSALYGNFALAGVVNVRTLERMSGTRAVLSGGAYGRMDGTVLTGYDHGVSGGVFGIRGSQDNGWRPNSNYRLGQGHMRIVQSLSPSATADFGMELYAAGWDSPGFLTVDQFNQEQFGIVVDQTDGGFKRHAQERASLRVVLGTSALWRSTLYATQGRWQLFITTPPEGGQGEGSGSQTEEEDRRYGFGATSAVTWSLSRSEITVGLEGRYDHSNYQNWFTSRRSRDSVQIAAISDQQAGALFVQSSTDFGHHFRMTLGGRFDVLRAHADVAGGGNSADTRSIVTPKLGALYHFRGVADLYANVSRGFRQSDGVIDDPFLPFITAWSYETGVKVDGRRVMGSLALFRTDVSNEQTFNPVTASSTSGGRSRRQGIEADLMVHLLPELTFNANWTINDAKYRQLVTEDGDTLSGTRVFNTARHVGQAALEYAPTDATWHVRLSGNVVGPYTPFDEPGVELASYGLVHLGGGVRFGTTSIDLGIRNLLDHNYPEIRAGGFVIPGQPRSVYGSVQYWF